MKLVCALILSLTGFLSLGQGTADGKIECEDIKSLLEQIYDIDQGNRGGNKIIDEGIDLQNQSAVVAIIERCGWPTARQAGSKGMQAVFLVIQHSSREMREKYFPLIKESAVKGDLSQRAVAMMEDRMLMEKGKKQKYGTQLVKFGDGPFKLHPVEDPENLNARRLEMGMETIEEYLKHFGLVYTPEQ